MRYCQKCEHTFPPQMRKCAHCGAALILKDPYHLVGRTLDDRYRIDQMVGIGGMGAVYSAQHIGTGRRVAFKILLPHLVVGGEHLISLFTREAQTAGRIRHPNIVDVTDTGRTSDGISYIVMEWLEGQTLEERLRERGQLGFEEMLGMLRQIASALDAAHRRQIVHRDLKPSNIMIVTGEDGREQVKVLDFGLAKVIDEKMAGAVSAPMGTPHYASPEQFNTGGGIDGRSDIYSLGVILYQALAGELPFYSTEMNEMIRMHMRDLPPPLRKHREDAPPGIEHLILRMMAKSPGERPASVGEVAQLFERGLETADRRQTIVQMRHPTAEGKINRVTDPARGLLTDPPPLPPGRGVEGERRGEEGNGTVPEPTSVLTPVPEPAPAPDPVPAPEPVRGGTAGRQGVSRGVWVVLALVLALGLAGYLAKDLIGSSTPPPPSPTPSPTPEVVPLGVEVARVWLETRQGGGTQTQRIGLDAVPAGFDFRFHFTPRENGYLYIISPDKKNVPTTWLTQQPEPSTGVRTNRIEAGVDFAFPQAKWFDMTPDETEMAFTFIFSREPLLDPAFLAAPALRPLTGTQQTALMKLRERAGYGVKLVTDSGSAFGRVLSRTDELAVVDVPVRRK